MAKISSSGGVGAGAGQRYLSRNSSLITVNAPVMGSLFLLLYNCFISSHLGFVVQVIRRIYIISIVTNSTIVS